MKNVQTTDGATPDLDALVAAYSALQRQNVRITTMAAEHFSIGPTDLRALMYASWNVHLTPKQLADSLELTTGATTSLIDRVDRAGLLERRPHPTDRRSVTLELTDLGREAVDFVTQTYRAAFVDALPASDHVAIARALRLIAGSLETILTTAPGDVRAEGEGS